MKLENKKYLIPFICVTSLFFLWGISNNLTGILIPHLRKALMLTNTQSTFVDTAVYLAYFLAAIPAGMLLNRFGYKKGIVVGLVVFSLGSFLFIPAADTRTFEIFLLGLFIIGCGLTILETAANPYATKLGEPETATSRLNLAQSFNGLAAFLAPILGTFFILSGKEYSPEEMVLMSEIDKISYLTSEAESVKLPYTILGFALLVMAIFFTFFKFPEFKDENTNNSSGSIADALKHKHLVWAVIAQFFYVGAQVCVTSFFVRMAIYGGGVDEKAAGYYLGVYGLLFMVGRFVGSVFMRYIEATKLLSIYAIVCIFLSIVAILADGKFVVLALGGLGFFMSIMFPTIFSLGIKDMGQNTKSASSLIVMSIIGGAIFPVIMGIMIDQSGDDIQQGYIIPLLCFSIVLLFGILESKKVKIQLTL